MDFRIADTFTAGLSRLTADDQKVVKTTAFDLQLNPTGTGLSFHKLDRAKDKNFWSVRASSDIRLIVHRNAGSLLLCYVDHHDKAYAWAERRKLEVHPRTGAAQLVEINEVVQEVVVPRYVQKEVALPSQPPLFARVAEEQLLSYGVPPEWVGEVKKATEVTLLTLTDHLPAEAAEALLELATGGKPKLPQKAATGANPFDHPDAQRRFRVMGDMEELQRALDYPWDRWTTFLHPEQRQWVERDYNGPAKVAGSAGTGKTVVALHRAAFLARKHPDARVLLATFSDPLANSLRKGLRRLISNEPRLAERLEVSSLDAVGSRLYESFFGPPKLATQAQIADALRETASRVPSHKFSRTFLLKEWEQTVDAWQLKTWEEYRDAPRLGRKTRLSEPQRRAAWSIFGGVQSDLTKQGLITTAGTFTRVATALQGSKKQPFDFAVVDEAQDLTVAHLRFLAALGVGRPNALFFAGDLGQRIFQQAFSWKALGVDVRGRSRTLRVNYRTSHQIRTQADRLLNKQLADPDGLTEERGSTVSVFNGAPPVVRVLATSEEEKVTVAKWLLERAGDGLAAHEIAVFVRSDQELERARAAVEEAGLPFTVLDEKVQTASGHVSVSTMHLAKGLEFRAVAVMGCDDEIIPLQARIEVVGDDADLQEVYDTERHLLYVACTRARDQLLVTGVDPASEFLDDLTAASAK